MFKYYCPNCGSELVANASFCGMCGSQVSDPVIKCDWMQEECISSEVKADPGRMSLLSFIDTFLSEIEKHRDRIENIEILKNNIKEARQVKPAKVVFFMLGYAVEIFLMSFIFIVGPREFLRSGSFGMFILLLGAGGFTAQTVVLIRKITAYRGLSKSAREQISNLEQENTAFYAAYRDFCYNNFDITDLEHEDMRSLAFDLEEAGDMIASGKAVDILNSKEVKIAEDKRDEERAAAKREKKKEKTLSHMAEYDSHRHKALGSYYDKAAEPVLLVIIMIITGIKALSLLLSPVVMLMNAGVIPEVNFILAMSREGMLFPTWFSYNIFLYSCDLGFEGILFTILSVLGFISLLVSLLIPFSILDHFRIRNHHSQIHGTRNWTEVEEYDVVTTITYSDGFKDSYTRHKVDRKDLSEFFYYDEEGERIYEERNFGHVKEGEEIFYTPRNKKNKVKSYTVGDNGVVMVIFEGFYVLIIQAVIVAVEFLIRGNGFTW